MNIDWIHFTPWASLAGGLLIGLAASLLVLFDGRIAGISGITANLLFASGEERRWRACFVAGLLLAAVLYRIVADMPGIHFAAGWPTLIVAGLLVGFGTRLGSGCTSGHGVCGLSRLSPRSLAATVTFIVAGAVTVFVVHHVIGN